MNGGEQPTIWRYLWSEAAILALITALIYYAAYLFEKGMLVANGISFQLAIVTTELMLLGVAPIALWGIHPPKGLASSFVSHVVAGLSFPVEPREDRADNKHHKKKYPPRDQANEQHVSDHCFFPSRQIKCLNSIPISASPTTGAMTGQRIKENRRKQLRLR